MKKNKIFLTIICAFVIFALTGCGNKTAITTEAFKSKSEAQNYVVTDVKSQFASYASIKEATVAENPDGYQVEFYVLSSEAEAKSMYEKNKTTFESISSITSSNTSVELGNYSEYSAVRGGYYLHLCRVDNTLLYVKVDEAQKSSVKTLIDQLGY